MDLKNILKQLCEADNLCGKDDAADIAENFLKQFADTERHGGSLIAEFGDKNGETVLLEAHIDEIGMLVTEIKDGFLSVAPVGGIDPRMLPGMRVNIYGKTALKGVFCSTPPHLLKDGSETPSFDNLYIDTGLGKEAESLISVGDRVTFASDFAELKGSLVTSKSLDDRAGVAALLLASEMLSKENINKRIVVLLSDLEETGGSGAKTASYRIDPNFAVAVDVSFGDQPGVSDCGTLGNGAMIGISPLLSREVAERLKATAEKNGIKYQLEVMGGKTSTDADHIALTREGVKTGLLSIPLRNMHTPAEVVDIADIQSVADILTGFVKDL